MTSISFLRFQKTGWIKYKRYEKRTVEIRYYAIVLNSEHECYPAPPSAMMKQIAVWKQCSEEEINCTENIEGNRAEGSQLDNLSISLLV
jgi:hypothetical protein